MPSTADRALAIAQAAWEAHRHNTTLLMALRETQLEQGARLDAHDRRFDAIDRKLAEHDHRFDAIDHRFDAIDRRFDAINGEIASIKGTIGRVAVGMYALEKLIRRIVPDGDGADS